MRAHIWLFCFDLHYIDMLLVSSKEAGLILDLRPASERRRYNVTPSLIGWALT